MRITKSWLREARKSIMARLQEVINLSDTEVRAEFHKRWPHRDPRMIPSMVEIQRRELLYDAVERAIPHYIVD